MSDETTTTTTSTFPSTITPHSTSGHGTGEAAMLDRYMKANPLEYPLGWTPGHEQQYNAWLHGSHYEGYQPPEGGGSREEYMEAMSAAEGPDSVWLTPAFRQQKYQEALASGGDLEAFQPPNPLSDPFEVDDELLAALAEHEAAREGIEAAAPGMVEGVHYVDDGSRFVPSFSKDIDEFHREQAAFWGVPLESVLDGGLEYKTPAQYYAQLAKNAARGALAKDRARSSSNAHPEGYIVHPDGFTEYWEDPAVTAQAEKDTQKALREYRAKQAEAEEAAPRWKGGE